MSNPENHQWTVTIQEENGDLILPFPPDLLSQMGWSEGTVLFWLEQKDGTYIITDKKNESSET